MNSDTELNNPSKYFNKYFRVYLIILSFMILILAFTPSSSAVVTNNSSNSGNYKITYLDKALGGNVQANPEISQNIPRTYLNNKIFSMTKNGSVVLKFISFYYFYIKSI